MRAECGICGDGRGVLVSLRDSGEGLDSKYVMCDQCGAYTKPMYHVRNRGLSAEARAWSAWNSGEVER